jgi:starvation-inducible DNA-binding protein
MATHEITQTDLSGNAVEEISSNLRRMLADVFALHVKTKNFHWHISGRHFRDYHLLLDEQATQIFAITDTIAERRAKSAERRSVPSATSQRING